MKLNFVEINLEATLPRAPDMVLGTVVNSFAARLPWCGAMPRIVEQKRDGFTFVVESFAPLKCFDDSGQMQVSEEGRKSRVALRLDMKGSLFALYFLHWLFTALLFAVHFLMLPLAASHEIAGLSIAAFIISVWPLLMFSALRVQQRRKLEIFMANLIYFV